MSTFKIRVSLLSLLTVILVSSFSASASANPGPFCNHRAVGSEGSGLRVKAQLPEPFFGKGTAQVLEGMSGTTAIKLESTIAQIKGIIYNTADQCQIKAQIHYQNPKVIAPNLPNCKITIGSAGDNNVQIFGEFMWKYIGNASELTEQPQTAQEPDLVVWPAAAGELVQGSGAVPTGEFTKINFGNTECGVFNGLKLIVKGNQGVSVANHLGVGGVEKWDKEFKFTAIKEGAWQHYWQGALPYKEFKPTLEVAGAAAKYAGPFEIEILKRQQEAIQEIALFEGP